MRTYFYYSMLALTMSTYQLIKTASANAPNEWSTMAQALIHLVRGVSHFIRSFCALSVSVIYVDTISCHIRNNYSVWFSMLVRIWGQRPVSWIQFLIFFFATSEFEIEDRRDKFPHIFLSSIVILFALPSKSYHIRLPEKSFPSYCNFLECRGQNES